MAKYSEALDFYNKLKKSEEYWRDKSEFAALRGIWLGCGTALSLSVAALVYAAGGAIPIAVLVGLANSGIMLPGASWYSFRMWDRIQRSRVEQGDDFNYRLYLHGKFIREVETILALPIAKTKKDERIVNAYDEFRAELKEVDKRIAIRHSQKVSGLDQMAVISSSQSAPEVVTPIEHEIDQLHEMATILQKEQAENTIKLGR